MEAKPQELEAAPCSHARRWHRVEGIQEPNLAGSQAVGRKADTCQVSTPPACPSHRSGLSISIHQSQVSPKGPCMGGTHNRLPPSPYSLLPMAGLPLRQHSVHPQPLSPQLGHCNPPSTGGFVHH